MTARVFPDEPHFASASEQLFVRTLQEQLPDDAVLFCNLRFSDRAEDREADLIVGWPGVGVAVIEVKGGSVSLRDGQWWQTGGKSKAIDPVGQARACKYLLHQHLHGHPRWSRGKLRTAHLVALPTTVLPDDVTAPDLPRDLVIDKRQIDHAAS